MELLNFSKFVYDDKNHYSGNLLLSKFDRNNIRPEIYCSTTNRSAGKTTWFGGYFIHKFLKNEELFCILMRKNTNLRKHFLFKLIFRRH